MKIYLDSRTKETYDNAVIEFNNIYIGIFFSVNYILLEILLVYNQT